MSKFNDFIRQTHSNQFLLILKNHKPVPTHKPQVLRPYTLLTKTQINKKIFQIKPRSKGKHQIYQINPHDLRQTHHQSSKNFHKHSSDIKI